MKLLPTIILAVATSLCMAQKSGQVIIKLAENDIIPEGIAYDPSEEAFYLGSINKQKIIKIGSDGFATDFVPSGKDSLLQVLGMKVDLNGRLWACNNSAEHDSLNRRANLHVYNLKTKKLVKKFSLRDGKKHLFNDLYITKAGHVFVTDSEAGAIYKVRENGQPEEFVKAGSLQYPNGITASEDEKTLYVCAAGMGIVSVDTQTGAIKRLSHEKFYIIGPDGLYRYKNTLVGVQNVTYPEGILQLTFNKEFNGFNGIKMLANNDPLFDTPTTGVIVGDDFYFIANSQLFQLIGNKGKIKNPDLLTETFIMKIKLN
jgi:hypothetical protein